MGLAKLSITLLPACTNSSSSSWKAGKRLRNSPRRSTVAKHLRGSLGGQVTEAGGGGLNVVRSLQVEESRADVAGRVGLVAVEAQPLAATLEELC